MLSFGQRQAKNFFRRDASISGGYLAKAAEGKREEKGDAKAQSRREKNEKDSVVACRGRGLLPTSAHPAFRGTSAQMPRGRFVRSERGAIVLPSEHTETSAGQTGKRPPREARQPPVGLS